MPRTTEELNAVDSVLFNPEGSSMDPGTDTSTGGSTDDITGVMGGTTPRFGLSADTFTDGDRSAVEDMQNQYPALDMSDSAHVGGTREDRRGAAVDTAENIGGRLDDLKILAVVALIIVSVGQVGKLFSFEVGS